MISLRGAGALLILVGAALLVGFIFFPFTEGVLLGTVLIIIGYILLQSIKPEEPGPVGRF